MTSTHFDPDLAAALHADASRLQARAVPLVVCCWDLTGYSTIAERLPVGQSTELVDTISRFLATGVTVVKRHGGIVHKFLGDGLMAVFGTPFDDQPAVTAMHVGAALDAAVAYRDAFDQLMRHWSGIWQTDLRCGIDFGEVCYGTVNLGAMSTVVLLGHTVNRAARLAGHSRDGAVVVSGDVAALAAPRRLRLRSGIELRNISTPTSGVWELPGRQVPRA